MGNHSWNPFKRGSTKPTASNEPVPALNTTGSEPVYHPNTAVFNAVYYPNWRVYRQQPPSSLNLDFITHIFYAFARVGSDGNINAKFTDEYADLEIDISGVKGCLNDLKRIETTYSHIKTVLSLGGGGEGSTTFPTVAASEDARVCFARSARQKVDAFGLDGIDIDWEHPASSTQGNNYVHMLESLRRELPGPRYLLTSALPAGEWALRNINLRKASLSLDLINLMTYDFSGPWTAYCGHQSQLYSPSKPHDDAARISCDSAVTYLLNQGVAAHKILLGIPAYGRSFLGAKSVGDNYSGCAGDEGTFEYRDLPRPGTTVRYDNKVEASFCIGGDGGFVSFDDPKIVKAKAEYAKQKGLGGLFYWTGTGDRNDSRSLVETGYRCSHPS